MSAEDTDHGLTVLDDYDDSPVWRWQVDGQDVPSGTITREFTASGLVKAELAGEALNWLINKGPMWDGLDTDAEFTITIRPARASAADLLGADPDWCGGQSVDEYMAEQRRDRYDKGVNDR